MLEMDLKEARSPLEFSIFCKVSVGIISKALSAGNVEFFM
jgi:hypothetical protein